MSVADLKVKMWLDGDQFDSGLKKLRKKFDSTVRKMERKGKKLTRSVTVPIGLMAGAAVKASVDFESAFAGVRKTVDATESEFQSLRKGILELSKRVPTSAAAISEVAEAAGQLGIKTENILEFSETMVMLGDTTNLAANEAATALARIANIMEVPQDQFDEMGSVIVDLGNNFATTEAEITDFAKRISGAANIAGFATEDVFSLGAAFTSVGVEAGLGGTAVQKVMIGINNAVAQGNEHLQTFADTAGMSADKFQKMWQEDAGEAFAAFVNGLGEQGDAAASTLEELGLADQRLMRAFLSLANAGDLVNRTLETGRGAWKENTALVNEARKRYDTIASRFEMLKNKIIAIGISIGDALIPAVDKSIDFVGRLTEKFEALSQTAKERILIVAGLFAAGGPLMWGLAKAGRAVAGLANIIKSRFGIVLGILGSVAASIQWIADNWDALRSKMARQSQSFKAAMEDERVFWVKLTNFIAGFAPGAGGLQANLMDDLIMDLQEAGGAIDEADAKLGSFTDSAKKMGENLLGVINDVAAGLTEGTDLQEFLNLLKGSFEETAAAAGRALQKIKELKAATVSGPGPSKEEQKRGLASRTVPGPEIDDLREKWAKFGMGIVNTQPALQAVNDIAMQFTNSFGQGMSNIIVQGEKFIDVLKNIGKLLASSIIQKAFQILLMGGLSGGGFFGSGGGLLGNLFGRDIGGPAFAGQPYLIGKGPHQELFIPDRSGSIVPNNRLRQVRGGGRKAIIENNLFLDGRQVFKNQQEVSYSYNR